MVGIKPTVEPKLTKIWVPNWIINPETAKIIKISVSSFNLWKILNIKIIKINIMNRHAIHPNSSAITAKIKSVCGSGSVSFIVPNPGPLPKKPPSIIACNDLLIW